MKIGIDITMLVYAGSGVANYTFNLVKKLLEIDKKRDGIVAKNFGLTLYNPYLEKEFVDFCLTIPQKFKLQKGIEKYILREFSRKKGLPSKIVNRPKKAFQYSTGIQKLVLNVLKYTHE